MVAGGVELCVMTRSQRHSDPGISTDQRTCCLPLISIGTAFGNLPSGANIAWFQPVTLGPVSLLREERGLNCKVHLLLSTAAL
jgi:hypothetical protein